MAAAGLGAFETSPSILLRFASYFSQLTLQTWLFAAFAQRSLFLICFEMRDIARVSPGRLLRWKFETENQIFD